ncbi:zf-BED domain-containing protein/DUF659 domain-containing protein/Dimer_Tnp_hAT domain-containing protein [Cinnamomum micranthum f. kanehirae]|uniref:Zf-BED domain-containing protein/DUF659 domain-containing protein/Dimer_Tnp_hAT domain-containing protein n=1 Tax=Cinnamomum micranthum f. kanehirae TaxID=337451 RepID=A0A443NSV2_9MAGN|nr:zf-BED domain-containing protein/DUF659 domain-containing protein/Dimer_Tnp_hAT domain-containing protein [Cinnamomum micranthum f. kanehirae]
MASTPEFIPIGSQKHDPAWKHCQMIKCGDRTQLKCIYCGKVFSGGGIHRIKEHLAGQKGNAASCLRVHADVRLSMQQSLDGVVVKKKKKKQKIAEDIRNLAPAINKVENTFVNQNEVDSGLQLLSLPNAVGSNSCFPAKEEGFIKSPVRRKRGRPKNISPPPTTSDAHPIGKLNSGTLKAKDQVHMAIGRFLYDVGVPLDAVNSIYFQPMIDAIASAGPALEGPSYHDLRGWILKNAVVEVNTALERFKAAWGRTGCSIMADEFTSETGKTLISFFIYCPEGTMFLKSVDASYIVTSVDALFELLKGVVEEVGVRHVIQVITNYGENYTAAANRLTEAFPTMFCTPCAARRINLMLEDIEKLEWINTTTERAQSISKFIHNHSAVLNMMRKHTGGKELIQPNNTRSAANFTTLQNMVSLKENLRAMVTSQEWLDCPYSKKPISVQMTDLFCSQTFWSHCITIIRLTQPLVRILRMVDSNKKPAMGFIYEGMYRAKETIKKELKKKEDYMPYWNIIDWRWDRRFHSPLHAAGFFLNPRFFYSIQGDVHTEVMSGMLDCIERLVPDIKIQDKINKELSSYKNASGDFGRKMAIRARNSLFPADWWSTYGGGCPNLTRLAIRILSQTCSTSGCNRDLIPVEHIHGQKRNRLEHQRLYDLVFVQYNLRLQQRKLLRNKPFDPISHDNIDHLEDWVVEKEPFFEENGDLDWIALDQPITNTANSEFTSDEPEGLDTGFDDEEIYNIGIDEEEDDDNGG